jgi:hypothetical protein
VQVVESSIDPNAPAILPEFVQKFQPPFPVGFVDRTVAQNYLQVSVMVPFYVPKMAFIDPKGVIQFESEQQKDYFAEMDKNIRATLDRLLKPSPATSRTHRKK